MLYDLLQTKHIYIVCGKTDLRKGIDGYGNIDIEKAKEYQDIVEEYYPIETIVY